MTKIKSSVIIQNGGFEQAILEAVNKDGLLNKKDKQLLARLKKLPPNRVEVTTGKKKTIYPK